MGYIIREAIESNRPLPVELQVLHLLFIEPVTLPPDILNARGNSLIDSRSFHDTSATQYIDLCSRSDDDKLHEHYMEAFVPRLKICLGWKERIEVEKDMDDSKRYHGIRVSNLAMRSMR
jgi:hypothetical protein